MSKDESKKKPEKEPKDVAKEGKDVMDVKDTRDVVRDVRAVKDASDVKGENVKVVKDAVIKDAVVSLRPVGAPIPKETLPDEVPTQPARSRVDTVGMPTELLVRPPDMPTEKHEAVTTAQVQAAVTTPAAGVEDPTQMPLPRNIPTGSPDDAAPAPGRVPPGDSRSMRREQDFALIYRLANAVITRFGRVGTRGQWRVVEYPTTAAASHAYARECSRFVSEGFSDYRD